MINKTLKYLKTYLTDYLKKAGGNECDVELEALGKNGQSSENKSLLMTLLHIEEERSAKMQEPFYPAEDKFRKRNPEIMLNLYVLISAQNEVYETALKMISLALVAFQQKKYFDKNDLKQESGLPDFISLELYPISFDQNNSLWQTLGSKMMPAVVYKIRTIVMEDKRDGDEISPIIEREFKMEYMKDK